MNPGIRHEPLRLKRERVRRLAIDAAGPVVGVKQLFPAAPGKQGQHGRIADDHKLANFLEHGRHLADIALEDVADRLHDGGARQFRQFSRPLGIAPGGGQAIEHIGSENALRIRPAARGNPLPGFAVPQRKPYVCGAQIDRHAIDVFVELGQSAGRRNQAFGRNARPMRGRRRIVDAYPGIALQAQLAGQAHALRTLGSGQLHVFGCRRRRNRPPDQRQDARTAAPGSATGRPHAQLGQIKGITHRRADGDLKHLLTGGGQHRQADKAGIHRNKVS